MVPVQKDKYLAMMSDLRTQFMVKGQSARVLKERTAYVDESVVHAWAATLGQALPDGITLIAVGGYGRKELFPQSDIDLLLLARRPIIDGPPQEALSEFVRQLWDAGLRVSQSVRTVEECCQVTENNFELTVSLLDQRFLTGDRSLFAQMQERFGRFLKAERRDLIRRLCRMARSRHGRFHNTIYRLEPDIKESPGGLRDLQTTRWLRMLREEPPVSDGTDPRPAEFLFSVRCFLHFQVNRDANLLNFELQDQIAAAAFSPWSDPAEWMRAYFRNASAIWREAQFQLEMSESSERSLIANFRDWRSRLSNSDFTVSRDLIFLRQPTDLDRDPGLSLRLFLFVARHGVPLALQTEQRVTARMMQEGAGDGVAKPTAEFWQELLSLPHSVMALRAMRATGLLDLVLPEWKRIEHLVIRDFYHQYTVDEHTLVTLEVLEDLRTTTEAEAKPFANLLVEGERDLWQLRLSLLLHDIGKGTGGNHHIESTKRAQVFLKEAGFSPKATATILFLIEHHLDLPSAVQSRDLQDPATATAIARDVKTIEHLRLLTLMSYADVSAVNSTAMTPWRREQFWRLYRKVHRELTGSLSEVSPDTPEQAYGAVPAAMSEFLEGLPARYLWTHTKEQAEAHALLSQSAQEHGVALKVERRGGVYHLTVVTQDRPFLFASLTGAMASFGVNILHAEAFANRHGLIIDSFVFADPMRIIELNPPELERFRTVVRRVALGEVRVEDLLKNRVNRLTATRSAQIEPLVTLDADASASATVYEVIAPDRPGLLYSLSSAISRAGCDINVVLVDTEAHRAIDVFHVTAAGVKLAEPTRSLLRDALLVACQV